MLGAPELEVRNPDCRAVVLEDRIDVVRSIKNERPLATCFLHLRIITDNLDLDLALRVVARADEKPAVVEDELHAVVQAAVEVEVVERTRQLGGRPVEAIVERGKERMLARGKRTGRDLELRIRERLDAERLTVDAEVAAEPHAVDDEPGVVDGPLKRKRPAVKPRAALQEPLRHRVKAPGDAHRVRRLKRRIRHQLDGLALLETKVPRSVQVDRNSRQQRAHNVHFTLSRLTLPI